MLSEEKIRSMIRLSDYEQGTGKTDLERTKYSKMDYVRWQILKTIISVTVALLLSLVIAGMYHMEYIIMNALEMDWVQIGKFVLAIYLLLVCLFSLITVSVSSVQYEASKRRVKDYYATLQELLSFYEKEENKDMKEEIQL